MEVTILGNNSALPAFGRHPTAQIITFPQGKKILVDCGEGTQFRLSHFKIKRNPIETILISHLHGDHFFGLPGLLTSLNHMGRSASLNVFGPPGIQRVLESIFQLAKVDWQFPLTITEFQNNFQELVNTDTTQIVAFPLEHRIPTWGFRITAKFLERNIDPKNISQFGLTIPQIKSIKQGIDIQLSDGTTLSAEKCLLPRKPDLHYAYCSDTRYAPAIIPWIAGSHLLYHEATFLSDQHHLAAKTYHSTASQAANIAKEAGVRELLLGHYSSRYEDLEPLLLEAQAIFPSTTLSKEGCSYPIGKLLN